MELELDANQRREISDYLEKSSFMAFAFARTNLRNIRNQFISTNKNYDNNVDYEWVKIEDQLVAQLILKPLQMMTKKRFLTLRKTSQKLLLKS